MKRNISKFRGFDLGGVEVVESGGGTRMSALCRSVGEPLEKLDWRVKTNLLLTGNTLTKKDTQLIIRSIRLLRVDKDYVVSSARRG